MRVLAPAKINLALHVTGKRADGYHLLDSIVVFANWGDMLEIKPAFDRRLTAVGPFARGVPIGDENLIWRAADLLDPKGGAHVRLTKNIPHGAGLGGGTADAAAALKVLARMWEKPIPDAEALLRVGADLPVCMYGRPVRMRGIGEVLEPLPDFPALDLVLARQGKHGVSTRSVFAALAQTDNPAVELWDGRETMAAWLRRQRNDLEPAFEAAGGRVAHLRNRFLLSSPRVVRMTGSGNVFFALFDTASEAQDAIGPLSGSAPWGQWSKAVRTRGSDWPGTLWCETAPRVPTLRGFR